MRTEAAALALLAVLVLVSGCVTTGGSIPRRHSVEYTGSPIEVTDGTFNMRGHLVVERDNVPPRNFTNVSVVLYDEDRAVIDRIPVGTLSTHEAEPTRRPVNVTTEEVPAYVTFESPDFWTGKYRLDVEGYGLVNGTYYSYVYGDSNRKFQNFTETPPVGEH